MTRNKVFETLGAKPTNLRWSWCALAPNHSRAIFTLWEDEIKEGRNVLFWPDYNTKQRYGDKDQKKILELVIKNKIPAYGLICMAKDPKATPRSIKAVKAENLIKLQIEREGDGIYARHIKPIHLIDLIKEAKSKEVNRSGLDDLEAPPEGNESPDRAKVSGWVVIRDTKVRNHVISRAKGRCEYCGTLGFELPSGRNYLEAHHIISLANQGRDTVDNVIALCPKHHRQAHYGIDAEHLEREFLTKIQNRK